MLQVAARSVVVTDLVGVKRCQTWRQMMSGPIHRGCRLDVHFTGPWAAFPEPARV